MASRLWRRLSKTGKIVIVCGGTVVTQGMLLSYLHFFTDFNIKDVVSTIEQSKER